MSTPLLQEFNLPSIKLHTRLHTFWRMVTLHGNGQVRMEWLLRIFLDSHTLGKLKKVAAIIDYFNSCKYYSWLGDGVGVEIAIVTEPSFPIYLLRPGFSNLIKSYDVRWTQFIRAIILWNKRTAHCSQFSVRTVSTPPSFPLHICSFPINHADN